MNIEEESSSIFQISFIEQQLLEAILDSYQNHISSNAAFLAERLLCERDTEEYRQLLAECYLQENKPHKAYQILKDCKQDYAKYLLAMAFFRCGKIKEAEKALTQKNPIPNSAFGNYLLGLIYEKQVRFDEAKMQFALALEINPTIWSAYEKLAKLGEPIQGNKIFIDQRQKSYEQSRKLNNCNIFRNITNLLNNKTSSSKTNSSQKEQLQKESKVQQEVEENENGLQQENLLNKFKQHQQVQPSKPFVGANITQSQIVGSAQATFQSFGINMEDSTSQMKMLQSVSQTHKQRPQKSTNIAQAINFQNYQNILQQPFSLTQQQARTIGPKKSISGIYDAQKVGQQVLNLQPLTNSLPTNQQTLIYNESNIFDSLPQLLRMFAGPYQLWASFNTEAITAFTKLPPQHYRSGWVLEKVARSYMDQSKYSDAERIWKELRECEPNRLEGMDYYSSCLQLLKKQVDLTHLANNCLTISHMAPESWIAVGNCFSLAKEIENALKFFNRAIAIRQDYGYAHTLCGHEYVQNENFNQAKKCYEMTINLDNRSYNALWGLGNVFYKQEKYDKAIEYFNSSFNINQNNPVLPTFIAMSYAAKNEHCEALKYFNQSEKIEPKNGLNRFQKVYFGLKYNLCQANTLVKLEQYESALNELERLASEIPKESSIYILMGRIYKKLGKISDAHKQLVAKINYQRCFQQAMSYEQKDQSKIKGLIESLHNQNQEFNEDFDL